MLANLGRHGLQWGKCQNNQYVKWFINAKKQLTNSWGRCAEVNKHLQKPGGTIYLRNGCHQKLGQEAEWELVPYVPVTVGHFGPGIEGIVTARELHRNRSPRTVCATTGCLSNLIEKSTTSLHLPGEVVKLGVSVSKYYMGVNAFSHWKGAPCKNTDNPCTFKVDPKKDYRKIAFAMKPLMKPVKLGGLFTVQQGSNCLSIAPKGAKPQMAPCKKDGPRQMFTSTSDGRSGMMRASMMAPAHCIYPASTSVKSKDPVQAPKCGAVSHELPEGAGFPKWVYTASGHIRFSSKTNFCVETKGKTLVRGRCDTKNKNQIFKFAKASQLAGNLMQVHASGRCIDNTGKKTKGVQIWAYTCKRKNKNQEMIFHPATKTKNGGEIRVAATNMCLDVAGSSKKKGAKVHQWRCHGKANQKWRMVNVGYGWFQIVAVHSGKCLDLKGGAMGNRAVFHQWDCQKNNRSQMFRNVATLSDVEIKKQFDKAQSRLDRPGPRTFMSRYSGKCIDNTGSKKKVVQAHQFKCYKNSPNQQFTLIDRGDRFSYGLKNVKSGLCLNVSGESKKNGGKIIQWSCSKSKNSTFWFNRIKKNGKDTGWFEIRAEHSNKCIDIRGPSKKDRAKIQQWECKNVPQQMFKEFRG